MVGLGESEIEVQQIMEDYRAADVDFDYRSISQPTPKHAPIDRFVTQISSIAIRQWHAQRFSYGICITFDAIKLFCQRGFC